MGGLLSQLRFATAGQVIKAYPCGILASAASGPGGKALAYLAAILRLGAGRLRLHSATAILAGKLEPRLHRPSEHEARNIVPVRFDRRVVAGSATVLLPVPLALSDDNRLSAGEALPTYGSRGPSGKDQWSFIGVCCGMARAAQNLNVRPVKFELRMGGDWLDVMAMQSALPTAQFASTHFRSYGLEECRRRAAAAWMPRRLRHVLAKAGPRAVSRVVAMISAGKEGLAALCARPIGNHGHLAYSTSVPPVERVPW